MPFTFAHPAILIPFHRQLRRYLDFSALVIGSMIPDFEYFIFFKPTYIISHTTLGHLLFNLPMGLLVYCLYHMIVKRELVRHLPKPLDRWFEPHGNELLTINGVRGFMIILLSLVIGAVSHVFWDAFTHYNGYFVGFFSILRETLPLGSVSLPIYKILQHGGSIFGMALIAISLFLIRNKDRLRSKRVKSRQKFIFWTAIFTLSFTITYIRMMVGFGGVDLQYFGIIIVSLISGFLIGLVLVSLVCKSISTSRQ